ncbi:hypothetical protein ACFX2I_047167 [Malus domestica]
MKIRQAAIVCSSLPLVGTLFRLCFSSLQEALSISGDKEKNEAEDQNVDVASDPSNATAQMHFRQLQHLRTA